jgi:hypothetical protein
MRSIDMMPATNSRTLWYRMFSAEPYRHLRRRWRFFDFAQNDKVCVCATYRFERLGSRWDTEHEIRGTK